MLASSRGYVKLVRLLLQYDVPIYTDKNYSFKQAVRNKRIKVIILLASTGGFVFNNDTNEELLKYACTQDDPKILKLLIRSGADINSSFDRYHPLTTAVRDGHIEIVKVLLKAGINTTSLYYDNAILIARQHNYTQIVKLLLDNKGIVYR
jgi:ankyrin repeat protein